MYNNRILDNEYQTGLNKLHESGVIEAYECIIFLEFSCFTKIIFKWTA